jgi:hypothetical protein
VCACPSTHPPILITQASGARDEAETRAKKAADDKDEAEAKARRLEGEVEELTRKVHGER